MTRPLTSPQQDALPVISDDEIAAFADFFYRKTGIRLEAKRRSFTDRRLGERMRATGAQTFREYFAKVKFQASGEELQALINEMTVNETYFFREEYQFDCLVNHLLDEVVQGKKPGEAVRIWSAPCSTGEEPYSLAIWILEKWSKADVWDIEIHGSDVDSRVLSKARAGIYEERALHRVSPELRRKYFSEHGAKSWQIRPELRQSIDFSLCNVSDPAQMAGRRHYDVIFCRNLLIYFDDMSRRKTAEYFYDD